MSSSRIVGYPEAAVTTTGRPPRILIADDQPDVLESLRLLLKTEGYTIETADSPASAVAAAQDRDFDAALVDLNYSRDMTSGAEGLDLVSNLQALDSTLPVVVMTAWSSVEIAVQAIRLGARDFIEKPWDNDRLLSILRNQVALSRALRRGRRLEAENATLLTRETPDLIATSEAMKPDARAHRQGRSVRRQHPHHRRARNRQGGCGEAAARGVVASRPTADHRQHRRSSGGSLCQRTLRSRQGRLHRRQGRTSRTFRDGRRRNPLSRRDRQRPPRSTSQAPADPGDRRDGTGGQLQDIDGRCEDPVGDQCRSSGRIGGRTFS